MDTYFGMKGVHISYLNIMTEVQKEGSKTLDLDESVKWHKYLINAVSSFMFMAEWGFLRAF